MNLVFNSSTTSNCSFSSKTLIEKFNLKFIVLRFAEYSLFLVQIFLRVLNFAQEQTITNLIGHITLYTIQVFGENGEITFKLHDIVLINKFLYNYN